VGQGAHDLQGLPHDHIQKNKQTPILMEAYFCTYHKQFERQKEKEVKNIFSIRRNPMRKKCS
jgi:hypothetical protein